MTTIHIARESRPLGKYPPEVVAEGLRSGRFLPTDLAWQDPMPNWVPLATFEGLPEMEEPTPEEPQDEYVADPHCSPGPGSLPGSTVMRWGFSARFAIPFWGFMETLRGCFPGFVSREGSFLQQVFWF